jgi:hypothetical protein
LFSVSDKQNDKNRHTDTSGIVEERIEKSRYNHQCYQPDSPASRMFDCERQLKVANAKKQSRVKVQISISSLLSTAVLSRRPNGDT